MYERLMGRMAERHVTATALAELLGIDISSMSLKLRGQRGLTVTEAAMIAEHLGKSLDDLFGAPQAAVPADNGSTPEPPE